MLKDQRLSWFRKGLGLGGGGGLLVYSTNVVLEFDTQKYITFTLRTVYLASILVNLRT